MRKDEDEDDANCAFSIHNGVTIFSYELYFFCKPFCFYVS